MRFIIGAAVALSFIYIPYATADQCNDVLSAAYDTDYSSGSAAASQAMKLSICSQSGESSGRNAGLNISVPGYGALEFNGGSEGRKFQAWCHSQSSTSSIREQFQNAINRVDPAVIQAWRECMDRTGPNASLSYTNDPHYVIATVSYRPNGLGPQTTPVAHIVLRHLSCKGIDRLKFLGPEKSFVCIRRNPHEQSLLAIDLAVKNSPDPVVLAPVPAPLVPAYTIAGSKNMGDGVVHFSQIGTQVGWFYQNNNFTHHMSGLYYNSNKFIGTQIRVTRSNGCTVFMTVRGTVVGNRDFYFNDHIAHNSPSDCDLPPGFQENLADINYSPSP